MKITTLALLVSACAAFSPSLAPRIGGASARALPAVVAARSPLVAVPAAVPVAPRAAAPAMGLFGLGWAELGVIGLIALFVLGPERLVPMAKDIGKATGELKEVTDSFQQGLKQARAAEFIAAQFAAPFAAQLAAQFAAHNALTAHPPPLHRAPTAPRRSKRRRSPRWSRRRKRRRRRPRSPRRDLS